MQTIESAAASPKDVRQEFPLWGISVMLAALYVVLGAVASTRVAPTPESLAASAVLATALVALSAIDLASYRLPDVLTLPLIAAGLAFTVVLGWDSVTWRLASALLGYGVFALFGILYRKVRHRDGLGLGDAKLLAASGSWLGAESLAAVVLWASGLALVAVAIGGLKSGALDAKQKIAFGPFLALGFWLVWLGWSP